MPIYEYECTNCHHHFDMMQKISEPPVQTCPVCTKDTVIKLISAAGFQLKGTGWYATDFKNKSTKPEETSTKNADSAKPEPAKETTKTNQDGDSK